MDLNNVVHNSMVTPCYVLNEDIYINNIKSFKKVLNKYFDSFILSYSFKTNSLPRLLELARENECFAEVVSEDEYELAERMGFAPSTIIYNGPVKSKESFLKAVKDGAIINIDSEREIRWLENLESDCNIRVGVRVNFDLENECAGNTSTGADGGRFGFCDDNGELSKVIRRLEDINSVRVVGLHMHISNATKRVEVYETLARRACIIARRESLRLDYIDIGGGFFGGNDGGVRYEEYISSIHHTLLAEGYDSTSLIVEPGASIVATAFTYYTRVLDIKNTTYGRFVVTDGSRLHIDPFFHRNRQSYFVEPVSEEIRTIMPKQTVCGYTCMEHDRIMTLDNEKELAIGDLITYSVVGSYSMCFNSFFITYLPRVYSLVDGKMYLVRDKWGVEEYIQKNRWML